MATLEERMAAFKAAQEQSIEGQPIIPPVQETLDTKAAKYIQSFNYGLSNILGLPGDVIENMNRGLHDVMESTKQKSLAERGEKYTPKPYSPKYLIGSEGVRNVFRALGASPEKGVEYEGMGHRVLRIAGETAIPYAATRYAGAKLAQKAPNVLNDFQKSLVATYQKPWLTAGAEGTAILGAAAGGEIAEEMYPESKIAEVIGELIGGITPTTIVTAASALPGKKLVSTLYGGVFTEKGQMGRASHRVADVASDPDLARMELYQNTELNLDPITATGDVGLMALEKAALNKDAKLAKRVADLTEEAMYKARIKVMGGGDQADTIAYLDGLKRNAAAKAQAAIIEATTDVSPVQAARIIRSNVEEALKKARGVEKVMWSELPSKGVVKPDGMVDIFKKELDGRSVAADPDDIPSFLYEMIGQYRKDGKKVVFAPGMVAKKPELGAMKDLRSRIQQEITVERAKDAPNRNKIRILSNVQDSIYDSLTDFSPEYKSAVNYSRELNNKFTKGKVGDLLGYERTGELSTSAEGTLDFLLSGNKDDVRMGLRQLKQASPESLPTVVDGIKSAFTLQAVDPNSGALNVTHARRFLKNNQHILDEFPEVKAAVEDSISKQRVVDELTGAPIGDQLSTFIRDKSVTALYLNGTPDQAMHRLVTSTNSKGQGRVMKDMVDLVSQDETGQALSGLKAAFGQYLLRHSETADINNLSGKKYLSLLSDLKEAARELYSPEEYQRIVRIGAELRKIEAREAARAVEGGIISDAPNKIISIIGGTMASRAGAAAGAGTSGASLRTASIFTKAFNETLGLLTNDKAQQILIKAVEDKEVLDTLLKEVTPENIKASIRVFSSFLAGQGLANAPVNVHEESSSKPKLTLEQRMGALRSLK